MHDQRCAAELRRDRSRGIVEKPDWRVVINERVCEGCGDCGDKSNCLSVQPIDTPYGRKTRIHQTSCNFDTSCLQGDCPAFAIVTLDAEGLKAAEARRRHDSAIPAPGCPIRCPRCPTDAFTVRFSGIGGTGVITVSQVLGTAAMLDGYVVRGLDQTGLSQKAGPVVSDLRLSRGEVPASNHANSSGVDCLMAFDLLVAASDTHRVGADTARTIVVGSVASSPTGSMVVHPTTAYPQLAALTGRLDEVSRAAHNRYVDAAAIATGLFGDATTANILLLGVAVQAGAIAVHPDAIERAIELNGVAVAAQRRRLPVGPALGRRPGRGRGGRRAARRSCSPETTDELIERLADDLVGYQSEGYADRFRQLVAVARTAEQRVDPESSAFTEAVARYRPQADGVQGRVRGGPAAARARGPRRATRPSADRARR